MITRQAVQSKLLNVRCDMSKPVKRKVICADAIDWLSAKSRNLGSIITSLPDLEETGFKDTDYVDFFIKAAKLCLMKTSEGHPTIFYQTDRLYKGKRISKLHMLLKAAEETGHKVVWHKIVMRRDAGAIDIRRPGFSHLICFGDDKVKAGKATTDLIPKSKPLYPNGMNVHAAMMALRIAEQYGNRVCDPFCGRGTVLALAEVSKKFKKIIGVDIDPEQCKAAKQTRLHSGGKIKGKREFPLLGERTFL